MSIKLILLKSGETLITDAKELVIQNPETEEKEVCGYLFNKPHTVAIRREVLLTEEKESTDKSEIQVALSPWILLTSDEDVTVPKDWVVTITEPLSSVKEMYEEKVNGQSSKMRPYKR